MNILQVILRWITDARLRRMVHQIAMHHQRAGVIAPYAAAAHELYLRRKLEDFRGFASSRYLEDRTLTLDGIKQEWLDIVVKPMAKVDIATNDAKALKAAIVAIPHSEVFIGEAKKARKADVAAAVASAASSNIYTGAAF